MKKKFVFTMGGLGNQIWIWNHIFNLKKQKKDFLVDISWFKWYSKFFFNYKRIRRKSYHQILEKLSSDIVIKHSPIRLLIFQIKNKINKIIQSKRKDYYFQNKKKINAHFKEILSEYLAKYLVIILKEKSIDIKDLKNSIGIHIRLGDRGNLTNKYIEKIKNSLKLHKNNSSIYIFSDENDFPKEILLKISQNIKQLKNNNELLDFCCLSLCKSIIETRNSSYCFWARELSLKMRSKI